MQMQLGLPCAQNRFMCPGEKELTIEEKLSRRSKEKFEVFIYILLKQKLIEEQFTMDGKNSELMEIQQFENSTKVILTNYLPSRFVFISDLHLDRYYQHRSDTHFLDREDFLSKICAQ